MSKPSRNPPLRDVGDLRLATFWIGALLVSGLALNGLAIWRLCAGGEAFF